MAKKILRIDYSDSFDFSLAGIVCGYKDYRLCFELNKLLGIQLKRLTDHSINTGKLGAKSFYSFYGFKNTFGHEFYILANKGTSGTLIPEKATIDYFLILKSEEKNIDFKNILKLVKTLEVITAITEIDTVALKSAENLLFD